MRYIYDIGKGQLLDTTVPVSTQLDLFKEEPKAIKPKVKEKPTYPFDTPQGINHVTKTLKEDYGDNLNSKDQANLNILNKEMKLGVLKDELGGVKKYDQYDKTTYPSDLEQRRRLKNISELEKSLGYTPEINVPYKQDTRTPNQKKRDTWQEMRRTGKLPTLTKEEIKRANGPSTWDVMKKAAKTTQQISDVRKTVNEKHKKFPQFTSRDELKYLDKKEEDKPLAVDHDFGTAYPDSMITEQEPITVPEIPVAQRIKQMADARLLAEQKDWDYRYGKGGIPALKRPE